MECPKSKLVGSYQIEVRDSNNAIRYKTEFDNLITNQGYNYLGGVGNVAVARVQLGRGSSTIVATNTVLETPASVSKDLTGTLASAPVTFESNGITSYKVASTYTATFAANELTGVYNEIGVGWGGSTTSQTPALNLFSHSRIKNSTGSPVQLTVDAGDTVNITYVLTEVRTTATSSFSVNVSGNTVSGISRFARIDDIDTYGLAGVAKTPVGILLANSIPIGEATSYPIGSATPHPQNSVALLNYIQGSHELHARYTFNTTSANISSGIKSLYYVTDYAEYQFEFNTPIMKNNTQELMITMGISWE